MGFKSGKDNPMYGKRFFGKDNPNFGNHKPHPYMSNENHPLWKGDNVSYTALHTWIRKNLPKQKFCEICGEDKKLDIACITGNYNRDFSNWKRVCRFCHRKIDEKSYQDLYEKNRNRPRINGRWIKPNQLT